MYYFEQHKQPQWLGAVDTVYLLHYILFNKIVMIAKVPLTQLRRITKRIGDEIIDNKQKETAHSLWTLYMRT